MECSGCGDGGPRRAVTPDSRKRALEVRILPATPDRAGVIATGRHTRLKPELMVVRIHPPVPNARVAQWVDAVGLNPICWRFEASRGHQVSSASVAQQVERPVEAGEAVRSIRTRSTKLERPWCLTAACEPSKLRVRVRLPPVAPSRKWLRSPTGRGSGLSFRPVGVRISPELPIERKGKCCTPVVQRQNGWLLTSSMDVRILPGVPSFIGKWRSLEARSVWNRGVVSSNLTFPTNLDRRRAGSSGTAGSPKPEQQGSIPCPGAKSCWLGSPTAETAGLEPAQ